MAIDSGGRNIACRPIDQPGQRLIAGGDHCIMR
jgi:hypothetical protein